MAMESKSFMGYFFSPLLTPFLVTIGYTISWFFVLLSTDPNMILDNNDWSIIEFVIPISFQMDLEYTMRMERVLIQIRMT